MQNETTYSGILGDLQRFKDSMEAKVSEIPHLEPSRLHFGEVLGRAQDLAKRQAALIAEKQDLSQQLRGAVIDGQRLATMLRKGLQQHFGIRSEKLAEFGLKPFRGRKQKVFPLPEEKKAPSAE
jgi:hypothetical protein